MTMMLINILNIVVMATEVDDGNSNCIILDEEEGDRCFNISTIITITETVDHLFEQWA